MANLTQNSFLYIYFNYLHVSSNLVLIIRRINCINTTSGISHCLSVNFSCAGRKGTLFRPAHESVTDTEWHIPEAVLMQLILLMMSTGLLEICRELKQIYIEKNCASSWLFTKNRNEMQGRQSIKFYRPCLLSTLYLWVIMIQWTALVSTYSTHRMIFLMEANCCMWGTRGI